MSTHSQRVNANGAPLALGAHTDLAILQLSGSLIEDRGDHLIIRTPTNPGFHWGNFVFVTDPERVDDAEHWVSVFAEAFPQARHRAVGLVTAPSSPAGAAAWRAAGLQIEHEDALSTSRLPTLRPLAEGYTVKELTTDEDWAQALDLHLDDEPDHLITDPRHRQFREGRLHARQALTAAGHAAFLGAFAGSRLVAELGIVDCGQGIARYQHVFTAPEHRRRGLTSHLLGVAARWASDRGCNRWVIVADADSDASRLYQACGFTDAERLTQAYRAPAP
jgi:GNAT superfamily N-acetyltransferase